MTYAFTFPRLIGRKLDWANKLAPSDYNSVTISDGRSIIEWYFNEMTAGVAYQRNIYDRWNLDTPNALTRDNYANLAVWGTNAESLRSLAMWLQDNLLITKSLPVTRILIMDIMAWEAVRQSR